MSDENVKGVWFELRNGVLEINPGMEHERVRINVGSGHVVEIDKLYGPLAVWPVRARIDYEAYQWVIEQEHELPNGETEWREATRLPCWTGQPGDAKT